MGSEGEGWGEDRSVVGVTPSDGWSRRRLWVQRVAGTGCTGMRGGCCCCGRPSVGRRWSPESDALRGVLAVRGDQCWEKGMRCAALPPGLPCAPSVRLFAWLADAAFVLRWLLQPLRWVSRRRSQWSVGGARDR